MTKKKEEKQGKKKVNVKNKEAKKNDLSPEEIFKHIASLSSCDCSSCPKNCFDK